MREYRKRHLRYVQRNRLQQRERDEARRRHLVKRDAIIAFRMEKTRYLHIVGDLVKRDAFQKRLMSFTVGMGRSVERLCHLVKQDAMDIGTTVRG